MPFLGPLTYTDKDGKTTLYGVVSGLGTIPPHDDCLTNGIYGRVSNPGILDWIKHYIKEYENINWQQKWPNVLEISLWMFYGTLALMID